MSMPRIVYAVFDRFPAPKGAAVHIEAFSRALGAAFGGVELFTVAGDDPSGEGWTAPGVRHRPLPARGADVIARALNYRHHLAAAWPPGRVEVIHFRSIFEGYPLAVRKKQLCRSMVFEVNGLPSIELKYHYPRVADDRELLHKLRAQEQTCLEAADLIITVSPVTADHLVSRGVSPDRIRVIPNGVDANLFPWREPAPRQGREVRLLYSGTMASWQGVDRAIEAAALVREHFPCTLTVVGPATKTRRGELQALARRLNVAENVQLLDPIPQTALARLYGESDVALAPLPRNDRNTVQGCCPLKVLEAMACGTPLVATDLPVVTALARHEREALLVRPGSAREIADAVIRLAEDSSLARSLSRTARDRVERDFTWDAAGRSLVESYTSFLGITRSNTSARAAASILE